MIERPFVRVLQLARMILCALADNSPKSAVVERDNVRKRPLNLHIKSLFVVRVKPPDKRMFPTDNRMFRPFVRMLCPDNRAEWTYYRPLWPDDRSEQAGELETRI